MSKGMATIYDVAKRARVSTYTVSAVLNRSAYVSPELTERVHKAVLELDYTINDLARSLQTRRTRTAGMLIPDIASPFYAKVVRGVEDRLKQASYTLLLGSTYNLPEEQARYTAVFRSKQVDGLLVFLSAGGEEDARRLVESGKPVVFVGRVPRSFDADTVAADNALGTRLAIEHLIARGHRRIAIVTGHLQLSTGADRVSAWKRALARHRLPRPAAYAGEGDWTAESGYRLALQFFKLKEPPDAIFAANFLMMTGILKALKECGLRCPEDVEVVSSDDSEWLDVFDPPVSTVVQPSYEMGQRAADLLLKRIQHPRRGFERVLLKPSLRIRV